MRSRHFLSFVSAFALLTAQTAGADLNIQYPTTGTVIYIGSSFAVGGNGASYNPNPPGSNVVVVKCWRHLDDYMNPPNCSSVASPQMGGGWASASMTYTGPANEDGYIEATQEGSTADNETVKWRTPGPPGP